MGSPGSRVCKDDAETMKAIEENTEKYIKILGEDWRCNGKGYVAFHNYIDRPLNWESLYTRSLASTPNQSERWMSSPAQLSFLLDVDSLCSSRELSRSNQARTSFSSSASESERFDKFHRKVEPAYSFVGMHCIFDQCKVSGL